MPEIAKMAKVAKLLKLLKLLIRLNSLKRLEGCIIQGLIANEAFISLGFFYNRRSKATQIIIVKCSPLMTHKL